METRKQLIVGNNDILDQEAANKYVLNLLNLFINTNEEFLTAIFCFNATSIQAMKEVQKVRKIIHPCRNTKNYPGMDNSIKIITDLLSITVG